MVFVGVGASAVAEEGLVGHWDFTEGEGTVARDRSGHGNDGTITGATWVNVGEGHALEFSKPADRVNCGSGESLDLCEAVSISVWLHRESFPSQTRWTPPDTWKGRYGWDGIVR